MNRTRWLQFGVVLVVAFVVSVAAGAWIGRQRAPALPVGAVPTQTPSVSAVFTPSPAPPAPTAAPTPTPSPAAPTAAPTAPPTASPSPPPALDPPTAEDFAGALLAAFQTGDNGYLFERLHPLVFERYGERQCRRHVNTFVAEPTASWDVQSASGPAPWDWITDELTMTVSDTWTVVTETPDEGKREAHFAPFEGTWRWFTDCGDPR